jgi:hypothetical protein
VPFAKWESASFSRLRSKSAMKPPAHQPGRRYRQVVGVTSVKAAKAARLMAGALATLGLQHGFVAHGPGGSMRSATTGPTEVSKSATAATEELKGRDTAHNAGIANAFWAGRLMVNAAEGLIGVGNLLACLARYPVIAAAAGRVPYRSIPGYNGLTTSRPSRTLLMAWN